MNIYQISFDLYVLLSSLSVLFYLATKNTKAFFFSAAVLMAIVVSKFTYQAVKELDDFAVYRYVYYSAIELVFLLAVYKLWCANYVRNDQYLMALILSSFLIAMYAYRFVDINIFSGALDSIHMYQAVIPTINGLFIIGVWLPTIKKFREFLKWKSC